MSKSILILFLSIGLVNCQLNQDIFLLDSSSENSGSVNYKTLSFSNNSESTSSILSRVFNELVSPAWTLEGHCDSREGDITVSGDIDSPVVINCPESGDFSLEINYSSVSPFFDDTVQKGLRRKLSVTQGSTTMDTYVFKTVSTKTVYVVNTKAELNTAFADTSAQIIFGSDMDFSDGGASPTNNWMAFVFFYGSIEGNDHVISNMHIDTDWYGCLFYYTNGGSYTNLSFQNIHLETAVWGVASTYIGALVCNASGAYIENVNVSGTIVSNDSDTAVGGLAGYLTSTTVKRSHVDVQVTGMAYSTGGLAAGGNKVDISEVSTKGSINMSLGFVGGFFGVDGDGSVTTTSISNSYSQMDLTGASSLGGLIGRLTSEGFSISNAYSSGNVVGVSGQPVGPILGTDFVGSHTINNVFYNGNVSCTNCANSIGTSKTSTELMSENTFMGWDFGTPLWQIVESVSFPTLVDEN
ncbi:MAG: hypothetical protein KDD50_00880 [Bdellovibrionales bacterium]|nr:hypothetical protein [Bdellovibrionales bacterium]